MKNFVEDLYLRPSCYHCRFKTIQHHADITLGDYWGVWDMQPEMDDNQGTSLVFLHSQKGWQYFAEISQQLHFQKANLQQAIQGNPNYVNSPPVHPQRDHFFQQLQNGEDFFSILKNGTPSPSAPAEVNSETGR